MSTIDRAMMGDDLESPSAKSEGEQAEVESRATERTPTPERALGGGIETPQGAPAARAEPVAPQPSTSKPARTPSASSARAAQPTKPADPKTGSHPTAAARPRPETTEAPASATASATTSAAARSSAGVTQPATPPPRRAGQTFEIDTAALEAQGFIVPETGPQTLAEEYRHIKRRILGNMVPGMLKTNRPLNLVMVTSAVPGEGKTFTSVNLALSIAAELDKTVLLVDSDIAKGDLTQAFGLNNQMGLFDFLENPSMGVEHVMYRTSIDSLSVIPAGRSRKAISEKLASGMMKALTDELAARYSDRVIIFDCPPILATTGAVALAPHVSQIIMVVEARDTAQSTVREALRVIGEDRVTGALLNKSKNGPSGAEQYYRYGYGYGAAQPTS